jgi:hypothetical protein
MGDFSGHPFRGNQYVDSVLYHGTNRDFEKFDTSKAGEQSAAVGDWAGAYFTPDKAQAEGIARFSARLNGGTPVVKTVRVRIKAAEFDQFKTRAEAEAAGYGGRVFRDMEGKITEVTVFTPESIEVLETNGRPSVDHSILSPNGSVSGRAREAALERTRVALFGEKGLERPKVAQPGDVERASAELKQLRDLKARGMSVPGYRKRTAELEKVVTGGWTLAKKV